MINQPQSIITIEKQETKVYPEIVNLFSSSKFEFLDLSFPDTITDMKSKANHFGVLARCFDNPFGSVSIKRLNLNRNMINRERLEMLLNSMKNGKVLESLESLDLSQNCFRAAGAKLISEVLLKGNKTLKHLNIYSNLIEVEGCNFICEALSTNTTLEFLDIGKNKIRNKGVTHLFEVLCNNTESKLQTLGTRKNSFDDKGFYNLI